MGKTWLGSLAPSKGVGHVAVEGQMPVQLMDAPKKQKYILVLTKLLLLPLCIHIYF